jgi:hypothetical protein
MDRTVDRFEQRNRIINSVELHLPSDRIEMEAQGHLLKVQVKRPSLYHFPVGGARGAITGFTRSSRKRLLELLARINLKGAGFVCFLTLTYPDGNGPPSPQASSRDLTAYCKRLGRRSKQVAAVWRREWMPRQSGAFEGRIYPHFHLIVFGLPFTHCDEINRMWREVLGYDGYVRTEIKGIQTWRKLLGYVSKYMAKPDAEAGGGEGVSTPGAPAGLADDGRLSCSLVYNAYLSVLYVLYVSVVAKAGKRTGLAAKPSAGRCWGVVNRKHLPLAPSKRLVLPDGAWLHTYKDRARVVWARVNDFPDCGFSLFDDDPERWLVIAEEVQSDETTDDGEDSAA